MQNNELILGKFQGGKNFGFFIPDNRKYYGGDFFVNKNNFGGAKDGDLVKALEVKSKGKKPEVKIVSVKGKEKLLNEQMISGIFSLSDEGDWGYIDITNVVKGKKIDNGYFVHSKNINGALYGDLVKARLKGHNGRIEAVIVNILDDKRQINSGKYQSNDDFGFVVLENGEDIFVPSKWKNNSKSGDLVEVKIIDDSGRRPLGIITKIKKG